MSYTKTNWQTGDVISKARLNHAEQGIYDNAEDITELKNDLDENVSDLKSAINSGVNYTLELGNINMSASGWNYYSSTTRVRIKQGETISLKKGSVIGLYDYTSYHMYIGWLVNGTYKQQGWLVSDFIAPEDAEYTILVTKTPETSITVEEVAQQLFVFAYGHPFSNAYYGNRLANKAGYDYAVTIPVSAFQYGNIATNGLDETTNLVNKARSGFIKVPKGTIVTANTVYVFEYDTEKVYRSNSGGFVNSYTVSADGYVRICEFVSNGNVRSVTITYPVQIPSAYVSEYGTQKAEKWKNNWLYDGAHRGSNRYIAPDTLPAYVNAKAEGYNSIEGDIRVTSDGKYVIHHDDGMPSAASYLISTHTLAELRANANMGYFNGEALPILELKEWLLLAKNLDMFVFAELKATLTNEQIIECMTIARDCGMQDRVAWMAELSNASVFRNFYPLCYLAMTGTLDYTSVSQYVLEQHPERTFIYTGSTNITDTLVANCASVGLGVVGWCVTYSWMFGENWTEAQVKTEIKRALACGAKGMILDYWTVAEIYQETYSNYLLNT